MKPNFLHIKSKYYPIGQRPPGMDPGNTNENNAEKLAEIFKKTFGDDATKIVQNITAEIKNLYTAFDGYSTGLNKTTALQSSYYNSLLTTAKAISFVEENEKSHIKTFNIGTKDIVRRRLAYLDIQKNLKLTNTEMSSFMETMEKSAPLYGKLMAEMAKSRQTVKGADGKTTEEFTKAAYYIQSQANAMTALAKNTTLSADQMNSLAAYSAANGTNLGYNVEAWNRISAGTETAMDKSVAFQMITEGIASAGADLRAQYGRLPGNLESAILKSKKLGISLKELNATGEQLLDIESSVGNELEYQQLTGKRLVDESGASLLNMYREATLSGDMNKQADVMNKILETQEDVLSSSNFYGKSVLAKNLGMTVEQMMAMREQKKLQDQITDIGAKYSPKVQEVIKGLENINPKNFGEIKTKLQTELNDEDFQKVSDTMGKMLEQNQAQMTPQEKLLRFFESSQQTGLLVQITKASREITDTAGKKQTLTGVDAYFSGEDADIATVKQYGSPDSKIKPRAMKFIDELQATPESTKAFGKTQLGQELTSNIGKVAQTFAQAIPVLNQLETIVSGFTTALSKWTKSIGIADYAGNLDPSKKDAIISINDGIGTLNDDASTLNPTISFDENDKLTLVAGPYGSINDRTAEKIVQGQSNSDKMTTVINNLFSADELKQLGITQQDIDELTNMLETNGLFINNDIIKTVEQPGPLLSSLTRTTPDMDSLQYKLDELGKQSIAPDNLGTIMPYDSGLGTILSEEQINQQLSKSNQPSLQEMMGLTATAPDNLGTIMPYESGLGTILSADEAPLTQQQIDAELERLTEVETAPDNLGTIMPYESGLGTILSESEFNTNPAFANDSNQDIIDAIEYGFTTYSKNVTALDSKIIQNAVYEGLKQTTIIVNVDPMAIHKEIEFRKEK